MASLFQHETSTSPNRWLVGSTLLHVAVVGVLLFHRAVRLGPTQLPGTAEGHRLLLTYSPGTAAPPLPRPLPSPVRSAPAPPPSSTPGDGQATGNDALGAGDITIALVMNHPSPSPDLSRLPSGTRGDVIVDVVIDQNGRIAKSTVTRGMGHGVDEAVMATIQGWTFQPAMRNGLPVASEQELLFHYEHS